jgi:hypothetical protein
MNIVSAVAGEVQEFVVRNIDSVPQLEALLLLRSTLGQAWQPGAVAQRLYIQPKTAADLLRRLHERELIMLTDATGPAYKYGPATAELVRLVEELAIAYARQLVAITRLIHSKAAVNVQGFADAFRIRQEE